MSHVRNLADKVRDFLVYSDGNVVYGDGHFYNQLVEQYGHDAVVTEVKRQKEYGKVHEKFVAS